MATNLLDIAREELEADAAVYAAKREASITRARLWQAARNAVAEARKEAREAARAARYAKEAQEEVLEPEPGSDPLHTELEDFSF